VVKGVGGLGLRAEHGAENRDHRFVEITGCGDEKTRRELVGRIGSPVLPQLDRGRCLHIRPDDLEAGEVLGRDGSEEEGGDDPELAAASSTQGPEEIRLSVLVAVDDATVCQHDPRSDELVGGEPVPATEDAKPTAERQPGDPDRRAGAGGDRQTVTVKPLVDVAEQRPGLDRGKAVGDRDGAHLAHVDQDSAGRRAAGETVPAAPRSDLGSDSSCERDRLGHVGCGHAKHGRLRRDVLELRPGGLAQDLEVGRVARNDTPLHHGLERRDRRKADRSPDAI
jgi:hypothetical protein